jgi:hypothetical protein
MSVVPSLTPSEMPSVPICSGTSTLLAEAPELPEIEIDCRFPIDYGNSGKYFFDVDTTCGGTVTFSGSNQIVDCQGKTISSSSFDLFSFIGIGPYIIKNCKIVTTTAINSRSIVVKGVSSESVDILIEDISVQGNDAGIGVQLQPVSGATLCSTVQRSTFQDLQFGIVASSSFANSQNLLELLDVSTSSNTNAGTQLQGLGGGSVVATITRHQAFGDGTGLFASGSGTELDVTDSVFCSSTNVDVWLFSSPVGTFSRNTCDTTLGNLELDEICSLRCN